MKYHPEDLPVGRRSFMVFEPASRGFLEGKLDFEKTFFVSLLVMLRHPFVLLQPAFVVFVNVALEGRGSSKGDDQINTGGGSGGSL